MNIAKEEKLSLLLLILAFFAWIFYMIGVLDKTIDISITNSIVCISMIFILCFASLLINNK